jgi:hypothetical protein
MRWIRALDPPHFSNDHESLLATIVSAQGHGRCESYALWVSGRSDDLRIRSASAPVANLPQCGSGRLFVVFIDCSSMGRPEPIETGLDRRQPLCCHKVAVRRYRTIGQRNHFIV